LVPYDFDAYGGKPVQQNKVEAPCMHILVSSLLLDGHELSITIYSAIKFKVKLNLYY